MHFTYRPNLRDVYQGLRYGFWGTPRTAAYSLLMGCIVGLPVVLILGDLPLYWRLGFAVLAAALWSLVFTFGFAAVMARIVTRRLVAEGDVTIDVNDEYLERTQGSNSLKVHWSGVSEITEAPYAYLLRNGSRTVFVIEKSSIPAAADEIVLRKLFRAKVPGARMTGKDR